jgi:outer membrane protein OmpA-like peptidoglycan-associated protein/tetratricopeptide (TPR) repeat protein
MKNKIYFFTILLCFSLLENRGLSQEVTLKETSTSIQKEISKSKQLTNKGEFKKSIKILESVSKKEPKLALAHFLIAANYRAQQKYPEAILAFQNGLKINPKNIDGLFGLAMTQEQTKQYGSASKNLEEFIKYSTQKESIENAKNKIAHFNFREQALKNPVTFNPVSLGININSDLNEYFPAITASGKKIIFTRLVKGQEDFYTSIKDDNGDWTKSIPVTDINTNRNEGAQCISADGNTLIYTMCENQENFGSCDLWSFDLEKPTSPKKNLGKNVNSSAWDSQPSLSADGNTMYFASTRPGGYGGSDIWYSEKDANGSWLPAKNIGPIINSKEDEFNPFIHLDLQTLYFSSKSHPGMGNSDLFVSRKQSDKSWSVPVNLGYPINTEFEESGIYIEPNGTKAFFSTDQNNNPKQLDIVSFDLPEKSKPIPSTFALFSLINKTNNTPIPFTQILVTDLSTGITISNIKSNENGKVLVPLPRSEKGYALEIEKSDFLFFSDQFVPEIGEKFTPLNPLEKTIALIPIDKESPTKGSVVVLKNVFFETNSSIIQTESESELKYLINFLNKYPKVSIKIMGHTDNVGAKQQNKILSEKRAKSVVDFLISKNISSERLEWVGFGEEKPISSNETPQGRSLNRRTEFEIK